MGAVGGCKSEGVLGRGGAGAGAGGRAGHGAVVGSRRLEPGGEPLSSSIAAWPRRACAPWMRPPGQHRSSCARGEPAGDRTSPCRSGTIFPSIAAHIPWGRRIPFAQGPLPCRCLICSRSQLSPIRRYPHTSSVHSSVPRDSRTGRRWPPRPCRGRGTCKRQRKAKQYWLPAHKGRLQNLWQEERPEEGT